MIVLSDSKCIKDRVQQVGWSISAAIPQMAGGKVVNRSECSRYVYVGRKKDTSEGPLPVWRLELVD